MMAIHFQTRSVFMRLKKQAWARLKLAPMIRKSEMFRKYQIKRKAFFGILLNKLEQ